VIKAKQDLPGTEGERERVWRRGQRGEMTQTMYAHVNKRIKKSEIHPNREKKRNESQEGKTSPVCVLVPVGGRRA
jgi:hypothetical protein